MRGFFAGVVITLLVIVLGAIFYFKTGMAPVATADPPMPFEKILAKMGLHARMDKEMSQRDVSGFTTADLLSGADVYQKNCAFCHGLLQQPATGAAIGMFPKPPQLLVAPGVWLVLALGIATSVLLRRTVFGRFANLVAARVGRASIISSM